MKESFLHFVWKYQLLDKTHLQTTAGVPIVVFNQGRQNTDSGPDFSMAKIQIGNTIWAGNIEIHLKTSDWNKHKHQNDNKYNNVILHVVYENDHNTTPAIPTLELKNIIFKNLIFRYEKILLNKGFIPCEPLLPKMDKFRFYSGLQSLAVERLIQKSFLISEKLKMNNGNWETVLYQSIARSYGLKINAETFENLSISLPLNIIAKHKNSLFQIESLLFGQSGLLHENLKDEYAQLLFKEYRFLSAKYNLNPIQRDSWHFMRLRPSAFPTVRIALFARLLHQSQHLFSKIKTANSAKEIMTLFDTEASEYWKSHYMFDTIAKIQIKRLGEAAIQLILLNSVCPVLFAYGTQTDDDHLKEKALMILESLPSEKNKVLNSWYALGFAPKNALEGQAMLQLKNEYCNKTRCLECHVGTYILNAN